MLATSDGLTVVSFLSLLMRPEALRPVKWRLAVCPRKILPPAVTLKRLRAPRWVFNFIFGFEAFLGIAKILSGVQHRRPTKTGPSESVLRGETRGLLRLLRAGGRLSSRGPGGAGTLLGRQKSHENVAFHARHGLDLPLITALEQQAVHLGASHFLVRHFAAAMKNHGAHFVALPEEAEDLVFANLIIVLCGVGPKLDFLQLRTAAALALLVRLLVELVLIFSVIGDFADRGVGGGRDFHQVQALFARQFHGLERLHDTELAAILVNHPDFACADALVDARAVTRPEVAFSDKSPSKAIGTCLPRNNQELAPNPKTPVHGAKRHPGQVSKYSMHSWRSSKRQKGRSGSISKRTHYQKGRWWR